MPFAARKDDDGAWRLCKRMGATITHALVGDSRIEIGFPNQAKTKACADDLNGRWKEIEKASRPGAEFPGDLVTWVLDTVQKHEGLQQ